MSRLDSRLSAIEKQLGEPVEETPMHTLAQDEQKAMWLLLARMDLCGAWYTEEQIRELLPESDHLSVQSAITYLRYHKVIEQDGRVYRVRINGVEEHLAALIRRYESIHGELEPIFSDNLEEVIDRETLSEEFAEIKGRLLQTSSAYEIACYMSQHGWDATLTTYDPAEVLRAASKWAWDVAFYRVPVNPGDGASGAGIERQVKRGEIRTEIESHFTELRALVTGVQW